MSKSKKVDGSGKTVYQPLAFGRTDKAALICILDGTVEIHGRDISRLWFVLRQVMDKVDLQIVRDSLEE